jgi:hypothetical protein
MEVACTERMGSLDPCSETVKESDAEDNSTDRELGAYGVKKGNMYFIRKSSGLERMATSDQY